MSVAYLGRLQHLPRARAASSILVSNGIITHLLNNIYRCQKIGVETTYHLIGDV